MQTFVSAIWSARFLWGKVHGQSTQSVTVASGSYAVTATDRATNTALIPFNVVRIACPELAEG